MTANPKRKRIGEILIGYGVLTEEQLQQALAAQAKEGGLIGEILIRMGFVKEKDVVFALAAQFDYPYMSLKIVKINPEAIKVIPVEIVLKYCLIPVDKVHDLITVAMADPTNESVKDELANISGCRVQVFVSTATEIKKAVQTHYHVMLPELGGPHKYVSDYSFKKAAEESKKGKP